MTARLRRDPVDTVTRRPFFEDALHALGRIAHRVAYTQGWTRLGLCLAAGLVGGLAQAPIYAVPALVLAFTVMVWVLDGLDESLQGRIGAFLAGLAFGAGYFGVVLHWVWLVPSGFVAGGTVALIFAALSLFLLTAASSGLAVVAAHFLWSPGPERAATLALSWIAVEWLRANLLSTGSWALIGYVWADVLPVLQVTAAIGVHGLGLLTLLAAVSLAAAIANPTLRTQIGQTPAGRGLPFLWPGAALVALLVCAGAGSYRLSETVVDVGPPTTLRIDRNDLITCDDRGPSGPGRSDIRMIIAVPGDCRGARPMEEPRRLQALANQVPGVPLFAVLADTRWAADDPHGPLRVQKAVGVFDGRGTILASHTRVQRLPFVDPWFGPPTRSNAADDGVTVAQGARTYGPGGVPEFGMLTGLDVAISGGVVDPKRRPHWLLVLSDDGWLAAGAKRQALDFARIRAVEEGLPVLRAGPSGFAAVVDGKGRFLAVEAPQSSGSIETSLPTALAPTWFSRYGNLSFLGLMTLSAAGVFAAARRGSVRVRAA